jgi:putative ABC transport system ATP-binding protein
MGVVAGVGGDLLSLRDVRMIFRSGEVETRVLEDVDLAVRRGELLVVLGPSGSGKSTLLNIIGGIMRPTGGEAVFEGRDLARMSDGELTEHRRRRVGFVFQFYNLVPNLTAIENVQAAADLVDDPMDAREALEVVGLGHRLEHFPAQLSGGEQQRVAIARAIVKRPTLLLCDEPTGALDLDLGREILGLLSDLRGRTGATVVLITHNAAIAAMADRVAVIGSGRIESVEVNESPIPASEVTW